MFKVIILICAVGVDKSACTPQNAIDVVRGPMARTIDQCIKESQATIAQTALAPDTGKQYMKIVCTSEQNS